MASIFSSLSQFLAGWTLRFHAKFTLRFNRIFTSFIAFPVENVTVFSRIFNVFRWLFVFKGRLVMINYMKLKFVFTKNVKNGISRVCKF